MILDLRATNGICILKLTFKVNALRAKEECGFECSIDIKALRANSWRDSSYLLIILGLIVGKIKAICK